MTDYYDVLCYDCADVFYQRILRITSRMKTVESRNAPVKRCFHLPSPVFDELPLVTLRKTSWKLALREMQWFLSGESKCPEELLPWWKDQLNPYGLYVAGYSEQLRRFDCRFDQIEALIEGLITHPHSRRHVITTWNPPEMASITRLNSNPNTPTTCHTSFAQFFVEDNKLHMMSVQRSADLLLGVPHNWVQSWALLMWLAAQTNLNPGSLRWVFGDAHIYQEPSHIEAANDIISARVVGTSRPQLIYHGEKGKEFRAEDFTLEGVVADPVTTIRPALL